MNGDNEMSKIAKLSVNEFEKKLKYLNVPSNPIFEIKLTIKSRVLVFGFVSLPSLCPIKKSINELKIISDKNRQSHHP